jgi:hypothetical protein
VFPELHPATRTSFVAVRCAARRDVRPHESCA